MLNALKLSVAALTLGIAAPSLVAQDEAPKPLPKPAAQAPRGEAPAWMKSFQTAQKLYSEKKYAEAAAEYEKVAAEPSLPANRKSMVAYGIARAYAKADNKTKATEALVKAIDGGMYDFDAIAEDPDLGAIPKEAAVAEAMKRNMKKKDEADAKAKAEMEKARADMDKRMEEKKGELIEKLKDPKGAGFEFTFNLKGLDGKEVSSKSIEGKVAIVDIWGTWCPPCRLEIPNFVELVKRKKGADFVMIGLNDENTRDHKNGEKEAEKVRKFAQKNDIAYPLAMIDPETFGKVPEFQGYPTTLFIDRKGVVRLVEVGYTSLANMEAVVDALLAEK